MHMEMNSVNSFSWYFEGIQPILIVNSKVTICVHANRFSSYQYLHTIVAFEGSAPNTASGSKVVGLTPSNEFAPRHHLSLLELQCDCFGSYFL